LGDKFDAGFLQIPHWLFFTGYSLFGQIRKVSSDTLAVVYTFPPFKGCSWTFTSKFMTMPVTLHGSFAAVNRGADRAQLLVLARSAGIRIWTGYRTPINQITSACRSAPRLTGKNLNLYLHN